MKTAFYPCCNRDTEEPSLILAGEVDRIVFCDINASAERHWRRVMAANAGARLPATDFMVEDAFAALARLDRIAVLFYRRDSDGEAGSGIFVLGDTFLRPLLAKFPPGGGLIVSDGSNSGGGNFKKMVRRSGLTEHGWRMSAPPNQPYLEEHGLWRIAVEPIMLDGSVGGLP